MTGRPQGRRFTAAAFLIVCVLGAVALPAAALGTSPAKTEKAVTKVLAGRGLTIVGTNCTENENGTVRCRWRARRVIAGWPYGCGGKAWTTRRKRLRVARCELNAPLEAPVSTTPVSEPAFGVNEVWYSHMPDLPVAAAAGVELARQVVPWQVVEPSPGKHWWAGFDLLYASMLAVGIRPVFVVQGAPCWAAVSCVAEPVRIPNRVNDADWRRFVADVARRYPRAAAIEVWNEPNYGVYWGAAPDPERYSELLHSAYVATKAANPSMKVISAGLASFTTDDPAAERMSAATFLTRAYEAGGISDDSDGVGYHAYGWMPGDYLNSIRIQLANVRDAMAAGGDAAKPLWITETGLASASEMDAERAEGSVEVFEQYERIPGIEAVVFHRWRDFGTGDIESWSGMVDKTGAPKSILCAVANLRGKSCKLLDLDL